MPFPQGKINFSQEQKLILQGLEQNTEDDILPEEKLICQVLDYLSSPLKMNLNAEKKTNLIEKNSLSVMASTKYINMDSRPLMDLKKKIKEKEKVAHPSNMNPNRFKIHWRPVSHKKFLSSNKRPPDPNSFKNNHKNKPMKD